MHVYVCQSINCEHRKNSLFAINRYLQSDVQGWGSHHAIIPATVHKNQSQRTSVIMGGGARKEQVTVGITFCELVSESQERRDLVTKWTVSCLCRIHGLSCTF